MWQPAGQQFVTDSDDSIPYSSFNLKGLTCLTDHYHIKYREIFVKYLLYFDRFEMNDSNPLYHNIILCNHLCRTQRVRLVRIYFLTLCKYLTVNL